MPPTADSPDAVLAAEQAAEATCLFALADFDASHQTLQRIEATLPPSSDDPRVQLNLWTAGYYADASSSLDSVTKELEGWLKAHPAQPADPTQQNGHAVAAINYGLLLFLQQQHASALAVLEPLFEDVDLLQDGAGLCMCVLLLEIYLDSCQLPKAVQVLQYLQGLPAAATAGRASAAGAGGAGEAGEGGGAGTSGGSSSSQQSPQKQQAGGDRSPPQKQSQKGGDGGSSAAAGGGGGSPKAAAGQQRESQGEEVQEGKAALVVPLSQALPVLSKTRSQFMQQVSTLVQQQGGRLPARDLGPLLHMYKARLAVACNNHKAAKKEVRGLLSCCPPPSTGTPDSSAGAAAGAAAAAGGLLLKAQLEVGRHQPRRALKALGPLLSGGNHIQASNRCRLQLLNLLAAVHHQLGKHHVAALYLSTAINLHAELQQQQQQQPKLLTSSTSELQQQQPQQQQQQQQQHGRQQGKKQQKKQQGGRAASSDPGSSSAGGQESGGAGAGSSGGGAGGGGSTAGGGARQSHWLLEDASDALSYNLGLQQLALEDWQGAMESFEAAAARYFSLPQLWLRWAEACLGMYHQKQQEQYMLAQQPQQQQTLASTAASTAEAATEGGKAGKAGASTSAAAGKAGKGQGGKKQQQQSQQPQQQEPQQQQQQQEVVAAALSPEQLLQQAAAHLSTGLVLLQEQQAAAARQLEVATAAVAAAVAAGEPPPDFESSAWALAALAAPATSSAAGPAGGTAATAAPAGDPGAGSSSAPPPPAAAASSSAAGGGGGAAPSTPTAGHSMLAPTSGSWLPEAALLAPELVAVRQSLLANQAYVHLLMGQPGEALAAAQELVAASSMSPQQHYLGSSYAAEALCLLGRVDEARQQLQSHMDRFAHIGSSSAGGVASGAAAGAVGQQQQQQHAGAADGPTPGAAPDAAATASGAGGATPAVAGSTKSYDGSCISCSRGVCGHGSSAWDASGADAAAAIQPFDQAAMLHNMGAVLMLQGDQQEGYRHAAMAAALVNAAQQQHNS